MNSMMAASAENKDSQKLSNKFKPSRRNAALLLLYGHILACARSYAGATAYYLQAHAIVPKDPLPNLCAAIAYIQRAMQRQTDNRHLQILQGMTFLLKYYDLQTGKQEAEYNMGRALHQIGLYHLAVPCYENVLGLPSLKEQLKREGNLNILDDSSEDDDPTDLKREAAYNLSLIYMESGSTGLAQQLLMKYCTI